MGQQIRYGQAEKMAIIRNHIHLCDIELYRFLIDHLEVRDRLGAKINLSVRNEEPSWDTLRVLHTVLAGRGFGGGHPDMAGGLISNAGSFNAGRLHDDLENLIKVSFPGGAVYTPLTVGSLDTGDAV